MAVQQITDYNIAVIIALRSTLVRLFYSLKHIRSEDRLRT